MKNWEEKDNALHTQFEFKDFVQAIDFMNKCVSKIEKLGHHPEWSNVYNKVSIKLTTHDAGNTITKKDRKLATEIDSVYCSFQ